MERHDQLAPASALAAMLRHAPVVKRLWPALLILALLLPVLAACGNGSSSGTVTLTYGWWSNGPTKDDAMKAWIASFESSHPNIKIKPEIIPWQNYWDKVKTTTAGGNAYDIVGVCSCLAASYFDKGVFADLTSFSDYQSVASSLTSGPVQLYNWNGKQYGLPLGVAVANVGYSQDAFQAAGVPAPDPTTPMSFDDFKAMAKKLTKVDSNGQVTQYAVHPNYFLDPETFVYMAGGKIYDRPVNPTKITVNTPEGIQGLTDYLSLFQDKIAPPIDQLNNGPWGSGDIDSIEAGKIAMARVGPWNFQDITQKSLHVGIFPLFKIKQSALVTGANGLSIYKGSKHKQEAWEFLKYAVSMQGDTDFGKFSDVPVNKASLANLTSIVAPATFVPTVQADLSAFIPSTMTPNTQVGQVLSDIETDMVRGKYTPAQAAAEMEKQGNAALASAS